MDDIEHQRLLLRGVDIADSTPPTVVAAVDAETTLVAILDGSGSWGSGVESSAFCREALVAQALAPSSLSAADVSEILLRIAGGVPDDLRATDFGWSFSAVALLLKRNRLSVIAAGLYGVLLRHRLGTEQVFEPRMLVDQMVAEGALALGDVADFPHKDVCIGPFLGDSASHVEETPLSCITRDIASGDRVLVAHRRVLELISEDRDTWMDRSAAEVQNHAASASLWRSAVLWIRSPHGVPEGAA